MFFNRTAVRNSYKKMEGTDFLNRNYVEKRKVRKDADKHDKQTRQLIY